jgi:sugar phosphate isomerase/epimerase
MDRGVNQRQSLARPVAMLRSARLKERLNCKGTMMSKHGDFIRDQSGSFDLPRRDWLKAVSAAGFGLLATSTASALEDLRARAKKNLRLGIMSTVYADLPLDEAARQIKADGFTAVVTDFTFADIHYNPLDPDWAVARKITSTLERSGIEIVGLFGYYNLVDPDVKKRKLGEARMETLLTHGDRLGCRLVSTETGTFNSQSEWLEAPENETEEGYRQCRSVLEKHARTAEKHGSVLTIEPYWRNIIGSIERAERLFHEVSSPSLRLVMDPCNFFRKEDLTKMQPMLKAMFHRLGGNIAIAHAKDVKASPEGTDLPAAGLGVLDYPLFIRLLAQLNRPLPLVVEHLRRPDVPRAREFVRTHLEQVP